MKRRGGRERKKGARKPPKAARAGSDGFVRRRQQRDRDELSLAVLKAKLDEEADEEMHLRIATRGQRGETRRYRRLVSAEMFEDSSDSSDRLRGALPRTVGSSPSEVDVGVWSGKPAENSQLVNLLKQSLEETRKENAVMKSELSELRELMHQHLRASTAVAEELSAGVRKVEENVAGAAEELEEGSRGDRQTAREVRAGEGGGSSSGDGSAHREAKRGVPGERTGGWVGEAIANPARVTGSDVGSPRQESQLASEDGARRGGVAATDSSSGWMEVRVRILRLDQIFRHMS